MQHDMAKMKKQSLTTTLKQHCKHHPIPQISLVSDLTTSEYLGIGIMVLNIVWIDKSAFGFPKKIRTLEIIEFPALSRLQMKTYIQTLSEDWTDESIEHFLTNKFAEHELKLMSRKCKGRKGSQEIKDNDEDNDDEMRNSFIFSMLTQQNKYL